MKENQLKSNIIYLSDSRNTPTNIPYRIKQSLIGYKTNLKIDFLSFNYHGLSRLFKIILILIKNNEEYIIHSHHLKSLIINSVIKFISKLLRKKRIFSYHTFHCELRRYSRFKLNLIYLSKFLIDDFSCVSKNLKLNWGNFLRQEINFLPIGISNKEKNIILEKSKEVNYKKTSPTQIENLIKITWIGRFEKVKNPLLFLKSLEDINIKSNNKIEIIFAGDGKLVPIFKKELKSFLDLNIPNIKVKYIGFQEREEVMNLISKTNLYINTSSSESFCVSANEFLCNPFCKLILPNIKNLKEIYECKRVDFYEVSNEKSLRNVILKNIENFFKKSSKSYQNIYPNNFSIYNLEETTQRLINSYISVKKNYKY